MVMVAGEVVAAPSAGDGGMLVPSMAEGLKRWTGSYRVQTGEFRGTKSRRSWSCACDGTHLRSQFGCSVASDMESREVWSE